MVFRLIARSLCTVNCTNISLKHPFRGTVNCTNFSFKHSFTTFTFPADSYWNILRENSPRTTAIERTLTQIKANIDFPCVEYVLRRSSNDGCKLLGLRFFIWAGQQSKYRHSALIYRKATEILEIMHQPNTLLDVVDACRKDGCPVSIKGFKVILNLCKEAKLDNEALLILKKMRESGCHPDTSSYNIVIRLICEKNKMDVAKGLMEEMVSTGLYPDMITCVAMIKGFCDSSRLNDAHAVFSDMRKHGCSPNVVAYSALFDGICKSGSLEMALELLNEMENEKKDDSRPNIVTYATLIQNLCEKGKTMEALGVLDRMNSNGCSPNWITVNILMSGLCEEGRLDEAYGLVERIVGEEIGSCEQSYSSLMVCLLRTGDIYEAEKLIGKMLTRGVRPNGLACSSLIKDLCLKERPLDAFGWFCKLEKECIDHVVHLVLLLGLCQQGHVVEAAALVGTMIERRIQVRSPYLDAIINELKKAGQDDLASRVLEMRGPLK